MINGHLQRNEAGELILTLVGPKHFQAPAPMKAPNEWEAERWVYFYNRLYISNNLIQWLDERRNVFVHVNDPRRHLACRLIRLFNEHRLRTFSANCRLVIARASELEQLAPRPASKHYARYQDLVIPIMNFCQSLVEARQAC